MIGFMAPIDWTNVSGVAIGASLGTFIGYYLVRNRPLASGRKRPGDVASLGQPVRYAISMALAAFVGCAIAEDIADLLVQRERPGGYFLAKYIFAVVIGVGNYVALRRRGRLVDATVQET